MDSKDKRVISWGHGTNLAPLGFGASAQAVTVPGSVPALPDLIVTAHSRSGGWESRLYPRKPLETPSPSSPNPTLTFGASIRVDALDGLRFLAPLNWNGRVFLVALGDEGLVLLESAGGSGSLQLGNRQAIGWNPDGQTPAMEVAGVWAIDWEGEGRQGLVVACHSVEGYWPDDGALPRAQQVGFNQDAGNPAYDQVGRWRGQKPQPVFLWFAQVDSHESLEFKPPVKLGLDLVGSLGERPALLVANWSSPGSAELVLSNATGMVRVFRNFGGQRPPVMMDPRPLRLGERPLELPDARTSLLAADIDGDGRDELLLGLASGRVLAVHAGPGRDQVKPPSFLVAQSDEIWLGADAVVAALDLDGDGDADLVVGDRAGQLWQIQDEGRSGSPVYASFQEIQPGGDPFCLEPDIDGVLDGPRSPRLGFACPAVGDWSGHHRPDLIVSGASGELLHFRNNGSPKQARFDKPRPIRDLGGPLFTPPRTRPGLANWFGSGELDLITLDMQGFLVVYPRTGPQDVGQPVRLTDRLGRWVRLDGGFGLAGGCSLWAGPFLGSDRNDILVGLSRTNRFVIPMLCGEALALDDCPTVLLLENLGENVLVPRLLRERDGQPLVAGTAGCSPNGVLRADGQYDLLIGTADGMLFNIPREQLTW